MRVEWASRWDLDHAVYEPGQAGGHYESYYQRANHPSRPWAFWIRYTVFAPAGRPEAAVGELWAVFFMVSRTGMPSREQSTRWTGVDLHARRSTSVSERRPSARRRCVGDRRTQLGPHLHGRGRSSIAVRRQPVPRELPQGQDADSCAARRLHRPDRGRGSLHRHRWLGRQPEPHWGSRHTDRYAYGQVAGFDDAPDAFLDVATAKPLLAGPVSLPWFTFVVLRHDGEEHRCSSLLQGLRSSASYRFFDWRFSARTSRVDLRGHITAPIESFVGLRYGNPPGGFKQCLNTKIGTAEVVLTDRRTDRQRPFAATRRSLRNTHGRQLARCRDARLTAGRGLLASGEGRVSVWVPADDPSRVARPEPLIHKGLAIVT